MIRDNKIVILIIGIAAVAFTFWIWRSGAINNYLPFFLTTDGWNKYEREINKIPDANTIPNNVNADDTKEMADRVPSRYACVGEYCDGSMSADMEMYTVLKIPLITSGGNVGCGSKIIFAPHTTTKTLAVLDATYKMLFDIKSNPEIPADNIRNPIGDYSRLFYKSVTVENGVAKVMLTGSMYGPGHCSYPEIREQINRSAFQFDTVSKIEVYLNGKVFDWCSVSEADPSESKCDTNPRLWIDTK